ncbi:hypothetical protein MNBD_ACTINO02-2915 [hydrothermal vent metagenome]|uniref:Pyridoxamine 5'-phosphate oxidase N-terminal domain-containing protein n=1 Tax=hydrothermal vent metagenome TaxID=652676 RepID=A0A3B0SLK8_9ZZZZ
MTLADERYVALTTFKKDGTPKPVPVWPVDAGDGRVGFITSSHTWKVKRMLNNANVQLQPSNARGQVKDGTEPVAGTAKVVNGATFEAMNKKVKKKYGYQLKIINFMHGIPGAKTGHANDRAVIITLDNG